MSISPNERKKFQATLANECINNAERLVDSNGDHRFALDAHQQDATEQIVYALGEQKNRFSIVHAGGSGKTVLEAGIVQASQRAKKTLDGSLENSQDLVLTVERALMGSVREHIQSLGVDVGVWGGGEHVKDRPVLVTSIQALQQNKKDLKKLIDPDNIALILGDEADKFITPARRKILDAFTAAQRIGFTATPQWPDGRHIEGTWGEIIHRLSLKEAIRSGIDVNALYTLYDANFNVEDLNIQGDDFEPKSLDAAMKSVQIEMAIPKIYEDLVPPERVKEWPTLVYVPSVATVRRTVERLRQKFPHLTVSYWVGNETTDKALKDGRLDFSEGKTDILVLCEMGGRGLDLPRARVIIDAYPTLSTTKLEQRHSRALRKVRPGSALDKEGFHKPFAQIAQILPKSNTFRPVTLMDVLGWGTYKPGRLFNVGGEGRNTDGVGHPEDEEVEKLVQRIKSRRGLRCNVTLMERVDLLQEIRLRDEFPMEDEEGFIYTEK